MSSILSSNPLTERFILSVNFQELIPVKWSFLSHSTCSCFMASHVSMNIWDWLFIFNDEKLQKLIGNSVLLITLKWLGWDFPISLEDCSLWILVSGGSFLKDCSVSLKNPVFMCNLKELNPGRCSYLLKSTMFNLPTTSSLPGHSRASQRAYGWGPGGCGVLWRSGKFIDLSSGALLLWPVWVPWLGDFAMYGLRVVQTITSSQPLCLEESSMGVFMSDELCCQQHHQYRQWHSVLYPWNEDVWAWWSTGDSQF